MNSFTRVRVSQSTAYKFIRCIKQSLKNWRGAYVSVYQLIFIECIQALNDFKNRATKTVIPNVNNDKIGLGQVKMLCMHATTYNTYMQYEYWAHKQWTVCNRHRLYKNVIIILFLVIVSTPFLLAHNITWYLHTIFPTMTTCHFKNDY